MGGPVQDEKPAQAPQEAKDYKFPAPNPVTGGISGLATVGGMIGSVPLVGSFVNEAMALGTTGVAAYHAYEGKKAYNAGNMAEGSKQTSEADADLDSAEGHLINAIPLVGFARMWM